MFFHVSSIIFVWASMHESTKPTQWSTAWCANPALPRRSLDPQQSVTIVVPGKIHALMMASNVSAERSATVAGLVSAVPTGHPQTTTLSRAAYRNYICVCWSSSYLLQPPKKLDGRTQNEVRYSLVEEMWPVSISLAFTTEFRATMESRRIAPYCEKERGQYQRAC